jgi:hypothetical protein
LIEQNVNQKQNRNRKQNRKQTELADGGPLIGQPGVLSGPLLGPFRSFQMCFQVRSGAFRCVRSGAFRCVRSGAYRCVQGGRQLLVPIDILFFKQRHVIYICYVICMISDKKKRVVGKKIGGEKN